MAKVSTLSWSSFVGLFNAQGLYQVGYAWLFGMSECFTKLTYSYVNEGCSCHADSPSPLGHLHWRYVSCMSK